MVNNGAGTTSFQFIPSAAGAYTITLTVTDSVGAMSVTDAVAALVALAPPPSLSLDVATTRS